MLQSLAVGVLSKGDIEASRLTVISSHFTYLIIASIPRTWIGVCQARVVTPTVSTAYMKGVYTLQRGLQG